jgi:hypothetical protein
MEKKLEKREKKTRNKNLRSYLQTKVRVIDKWVLTDGRPAAKQTTSKNYRETATTSAEQANNMLPTAIMRNVRAIYEGHGPIALKQIQKYKRQCFFSLRRYECGLTVHLLSYRMFRHFRCELKRLPLQKKNIYIRQGKQICWLQKLGKAFSCTLSHKWETKCYGGRRNRGWCLRP